MVEFSKLIERGKTAKPASGGKPAGAAGGLNLRKLANRRRKQELVRRAQAGRESKGAAEDRKVLYAQTTEFLSLAFSTIKDDRYFSLEPGFRILEKIVDTRAPIDALFLKAIHDEESYDLLVSPSVNVAIYAIKMAENLGFSKNRQVEIGMVGLLHDIGMAKIPEELICKQTLTNDEFLVFKERPHYGYDILSAFKKAYAYLPECALQIHERIDGSGYPRGLKDDEIHEYAQIIGLVDIYEALIHARPQREKILHFYAVKEIIKTGKDKFQQRYLKALLNTFSIFPINSYVRLNSGAIGRVVRTYPDQPMRPKIQIIYDSQRKRVLTERLINLPDHSLLYIMDSVSEQDLVEMSEASYLLAKPGQGTRSDDEPADDEAAVSDAPDEIGAPGEAGDIAAEEIEPEVKAVPGERFRNTFFKKLLLAAAVLFFIAGIVWQILVDTAVNEPESARERATEPSFESGKRHLPATLSAAPAKTAVSPVPLAIPSQKGTAVATESTASGVPSGKVGLRTSQKPVLENTGETKVSPAAPDVLSPPAVVKAAEESRESGKTPMVAVAAETYGPPEQGRYPYSILLASFKKLQTAQKSFAAYRAKGIAPFWVKVDLGPAGVWFRVFSGHYPDKQRARAAIDRIRLNGALAKPTRYATWIGGFSDIQTLNQKRTELETLGFSPYAITEHTGEKHLYVGAFYTEQGATEQQKNLQRAGITSRVVER